jgi:signal transduction histidine kinase
MSRIPFRASDGRIVGVVGMSRDITDYKESLLEQDRLIAELQAKNAELERFTYTVSHDLKSPLVTIAGFLGYLEKDALSGNMDRLRQDIGKIQEAAKQMKRLLEDLLELSRIGRLVNPPTEVPFADILHEALDMMSIQVAELKIEVVYPPDFPVVRVDRLRLIEVMQNLLENAVKFMGSQPQPRLEIGMRQPTEGDEMIFFVKDNGIGIDTHYHETVFGLFHRLNPEIEGTGIGLALVKRIIETHGGRIWIESAGEAQGTTFCFTLPGEALA